jgi:hypothetical protein
MSARGFRGASPKVRGNDEFTVALLHFDGSDGSTTFTDVNAGGSAHTWTASGNAQIDTAQSKFGGASLLLDGTGDYISTPDHADFDLGAGEFTIDMWVRFNALPTGLAGSGNGAFLAAQWINASRAWVTGVEFTGTNYRLFLLHNNTTSSGSNVSLSTGVWYHVAFVRDNTGTDTLRFFLDGVAAGTGSIDGVTIANSTSSVVIGASPEAHSYLNGWIDEVRISKGVARWTATFTPPKRAYS